ncbi:MAG: hypothetical protein AB1458_09650 [Bacteroidota bacterium]
MNTIKLIVPALFLGLGVNAQSFVKGQKDINLGIGFGNTFIGSGYRTTIPAISFSFDFGLTGEISLGGYLGYTGASYEFYGQEVCNSGNNAVIYNYHDTYAWTYTIVGLRASYHFAEFIEDDKMDLYAGLMLGNNIARYRLTTNSVCPSHAANYGSGTYGGFTWSLHAGLRYRLKENLGVFGEVGYGIAYVTLGVTYKI